MCGTGIPREVGVGVGLDLGGDGLGRSVASCNFEDETVVDSRVGGEISNVRESSLLSTPDFCPMLWASDLSD